MGREVSDGSMTLMMLSKICARHTVKPSSYKDAYKFTMLMGYIFRSKYFYFE